MKLKHILISVLGLPFTAQAASVLTGGHADAPGFGYQGGAFEPHIHVSAGAIIDGVAILSEAEFEPEDLVIAVPPSSTATIASTTYYVLPEGHEAAGDAGAAHIGFGLEELTDTDWVGGMVTITLLNFTGPGNFLLWQDDGLGGQIVFLDTANNDYSFTAAAGGHSHFNWGFTDNSMYDLEFEISGTHVTDGFQSASGTYTYMVPEPSSAAVLGLAGAALLLRRKQVR